MKRIASVGVVGLGIVLLVAGASFLARRNVLPRGITGEFDYQTGDFRQWDGGIQQKAQGRATIQPSPVGDGEKWARYTVEPGDHLGSDPEAERAEALLTPATTGAIQGADQWWAWSTYFAPSYADPQITTYPAWHLFTDFHSALPDGWNTQFQFDAETRRLQLELQPGGRARDTWKARVYDLGAWRAGVRYDFVFHVIWSTNPKAGLIDVWVNGDNVLPPTHTQTLFTATDTPYLKQGFYRQKASDTAIVWHTGTRRGTSYAAVVAGFPARRWRRSRDDGGWRRPRRAAAARGYGMCRRSAPSTRHPGTAVIRPPEAHPAGSMRPKRPCSSWSGPAAK